MFYLGPPNRRLFQPRNINDHNQLDDFFLSSPKSSRSPRKFSVSLRIKEALAKLLPAREQLRHLPKVLSRRERYLILVLALIAVFSLISIPVSIFYHFTKPVADFGGSFTEGAIGAPKFINPLLAQTDVDRDLSGLIYAGLMKYDGQGKVVPGLAASYDVASDGLTYTFNLRENLKWHDGQPFAADDVIFTILAAQNADYGSFQRINWQGVDVSKLDDKTVVFKLRNKYAQFLNNTVLGILPKHVWANIKPSTFSLADYNLKPVGSGPYKFSKIRRDTAGNVKSFEMVAFDKYYAGKPYISKITFQFYLSEDELAGAYNNGAIDSMDSLTSQKLNSLRFPGKLIIKRLKLPRYFAVFFNQNKSQALSDKNVRLALSYATDKKEILHKILDDNGIVVDSPMLPGIIDISDDAAAYGFDAAKAQKILDDNNWKYSETDKVREKASAAPKNKNVKKTAEPVKLEIQLTTSSWPELVTVANQIKKQWETMGVKVDLRILQLQDLQQAIKDRDYEALLFGEVLGLNPDPFSFWHSSQKRDPGLNLALYDNKDADKLLEDARQTMDFSARMSKYDDFQKLTAKDIPAVFIYSPYYLYAQTSKIKGNATDTISMPSDRFVDVNKWYIDTKRVGRNK